jgi:hypothetical protein
LAHLNEEVDGDTLAGLMVRGQWDAS